MTTTWIYLDNNAATRLDPRVLEAMMPFLTERYGNPSSLHHFGAREAAVIEEARARVAALIGAKESEILFTAGGTESNNAALRGVFAARPGKKHLVVSAIEHAAILEPAETLKKQGIDVTQIGADRDGRLDLDQLRDSLREDTLLVSIMLANNETGVIHPLDEISRIARERGVLVHTDAVNAAGKIPIDVEKLGVDLLSLSAHKFHGPKGAGALYLRRGVPFRPYLLGGSQERGRRGGTYNVPGIVGLGAACELLLGPEAGAAEAVRVLRDELEAGLCRLPHKVSLIARDVPRLPNTTCVCFDNLPQQAILLLLSESGVCASSGSACSSGSLEASHVLQAMGIPANLAMGQVRFSLGRFNAPADVRRTLEILPGVLGKVAASRIEN